MMACLPAARGPPDPGSWRPHCAIAQYPLGLLPWRVLHTPELSLCPEAPETDGHVLRTMFRQV